MGGWGDEACDLILHLQWLHKESGIREDNEDVHLLCVVEIKILWNLNAK